MGDVPFGNGSFASKGKEKKRTGNAFFEAWSKKK
jgi:hypothetical protein